MYTGHSLNQPLDRVVLFSEQSLRAVGDYKYAKCRDNNHGRLTHFQKYLCTFRTFMYTGHSLNQPLDRVVQFSEQSLRVVGD